MPRAVKKAKAAAKAPPPELPARWRAVIDDHVIGLEVSPDGRRVAAAAVSGPIAVLDADTGAWLASLNGHGFGTTAIAWSPDGAMLASAGQDGHARLWFVDEGYRSVALDGGAAWVEHLAWSPDGSMLATGAGRSVRVFGRDGRLLVEYPSQRATVAALAWEPGTRMLTAGVYGAVVFFDADSTAAEPARVLDWKGSILCLGWSPTREALAAGGQDASVQFWFFRDSDRLEMSGFPTKVGAVSWDSKGDWLATSGGGTPCVWDCTGAGPKGRRPVLCEGHEDVVVDLRFAPRTPVLGSIDASGLALLFTPASGKRAIGQARVDGGGARIVYAPNGSLLVLGGATGEVLACGR